MKMDNSWTFSDIINSSGKLAYTVRGLSMLPLLRQGIDVVVIEKTEKPLKKYDVVLFQRRNGKYVLHRILKVYKGKYWIVGDNDISGEMIDEEQIIGVMTSIKRGNRIVKTTDLGYRLYVHLWCDVYPVRFIMLRIKRFIIRGYKFIKRRVFG